MANSLPRIRWPHCYPICLLGGVVVAFVLTTATAYFQIHRLLPLQRYYLMAFLKASTLPISQKIQILQLKSAKGYVTAIDPWISAKKHQNRIAFTLTDQALALGLSHPRFVETLANSPKLLRRFLETSIYHATLAKLFRVTLSVFALSLAIGMILGARLDQKHQEQARRGVQIRGPVLMTPQRARHYLKGNGIALFLEPKTK